MVLMAEKGGTRILAFFIICIVLASILISGYIGNDNEERSLLTIWVRNKTQNNLTFNISLLDNGNELYNSTTTIQKEDYEKITLDFEYDEYIVNIYYNESIRINKEIRFERYSDHHYFDIYKDRIKYIPSPHP